MLLRHRAPKIDHRPANPAQGFEHLDAGSVAVLRWLGANRVDYVLVGAVAEAIRGHREARGPIAIVPAPYRRNYTRLAEAFDRMHVRQRVEHATAGEDTVPILMTVEKLARGHRWALRAGPHDLDIEPLSSGEGAPGYQELLYEATRFEVAEGVAVEVASPEDIEHYAHRARTGLTPYMRVMRAAGGGAGAQRAIPETDGEPAPGASHASNGAIGPGSD